MAVNILPTYLLPTQIDLGCGVKGQNSTDGQAQNNRDNVLFTSLLIGLSFDFLRWWHVHVRVVCVRACVRV